MWEEDLIESSITFGETLNQALMNAPQYHHELPLGVSSAPLATNRPTTTKQAAGLQMWITAQMPSPYRLATLVRMVPRTYHMRRVCPCLPSSWGSIAPDPESPLGVDKPPYHLMTSLTLVSESKGHSVRGIKKEKK